MISIRCFWSHEEILFIAKIIAGQRSARVCNCIAQGIFDRVSWKSTLKIYLLLHFLSNHSETFRICSRDHLEEISRMEFWDRPFKNFIRFWTSWTSFFAPFTPIRSWESWIKYVNRYSRVRKNGVWPNNRTTWNLKTVKLCSTPLNVMISTILKPSMSDLLQSEAGISWIKCVNRYSRACKSVGLT